MPGCVTVKALPPTLIVPVLGLELVFALTVIDTAPLPTPEELVDSQLLPDVTFAVQLQPPGAVTVDMPE